MATTLTRFKQRAEALDYLSAGGNTAGDVVVAGNTALPVVKDLAAGVQGALAAEGVWTFPKATSAGSALAWGTKVYWDATNSVATRLRAGGTNKLIGTVTTQSGADADTTVDVLLTPTASADALVFAQVVASSAVTTTAAETDCDQNFTFPANTLNPGDVIRVRAQGIATATNSTDTLTAKAYIGATVIEATAAVDVANNDIFYFDFAITVRTNGAGGTIVACGVQGLGTPGTVTAKPFNLGSTAIDTTAVQKIKITLTWSTNNAGNSARLDILNVERLAA